MMTQGKKNLKPLRIFVENIYRSIYIKKIVHCRGKISRWILKGAFVIIKLERSIAMKELFQY